MFLHAWSSFSQLYKLWKASWWVCAKKWAHIKFFDTKWNAAWIVMMSYESVETGSSSCYRNRQGFDIKIKQWGCGGQVREWMYTFTFSSSVLQSLLELQITLLKSPFIWIHDHTCVCVCRGFFTIAHLPVTSTISELLFMYQISGYWGIVILSAICILWSCTEQNVPSLKLLHLAEGEPYWLKMWNNGGHLSGIWYYQ